MRNLWSWLRIHDIPNSLGFLFSLIVWPLVLFWWHHRKRNSIPGLEVHFTKGAITINGSDHSAVSVTITNHTGSVVYISGPSIRRCSKFFPIPTQAAADIGGDSHHLAFYPPGGNQLRLREITLQTNDAAQTEIPVTNPPEESFYKHRSNLFRRLLHWPRYFILEYVAMVGTKRYLVSTIY